MDSVLIEIKGLIDGLAGIVVAFGGLAAALYGLVKVIKNLQKNQKEQTKGIIKIPKRVIVTIVFSIALSTSVAWARFYLPDAISLALNQRVTTKAWKSFAKGEERFLKDMTVEKEAFEEANRLASFAIGEFSGTAVNQQQEVRQANLAVPPIGLVGESERASIFSLGLINDVGTCYFIKGRSLEYLGQKEQARSAYQAATNFTYSRTWDPRTKIFWSPAEAAAGRLKQIN